MQRVVRLSFVGLLALAGAGITACGDKVTVPPPNASGDSVVTSVTVAPASQAMNVGDKFQFAATVTAGSKITDRTVKWSSSAPSIATVDPASGLVTAVAPGGAVITAASNANPVVTGSAAVTVTAGTPAVLSFSSFTQTACDPVTKVCNTASANLNNVANQLDVNVNLDAGTQKVTEVDLVMNCGGADTIVARQTFASADLAPEAEDNASVIDLPVNTAFFNPTTGVVAFKNGACTLKTQALVAGGKIVANASQGITLNNTNFIQATLSTTPGTGQVASATDANGLAWKAGAVTVTAIPVIFTPSVTAASGAVSLINGGLDSAFGKNGVVVKAGGVVGTLSGLTPASGVLTASFPLSTTATGGVGGAMVDTLTVSVSTVDSNGNPGPTLAASTGNFIRLDNKAPNITSTPPTFVAGTQNTANGWVGANFSFSTAAGSLTAGSSSSDNQVELDAINPSDKSTGGVDKVTITTQFAPQGTSPTASTGWTTFTSVANLTETSAATGSVAYDLRLLICDALGNCSTTGTLTTFGVDKTAPTATTASGPKDKEIVGIGQSLSATSVSVSASDPQGAGGVAGSGFGSNPVLVSETQLAPSGATGQATTCVIGVPLSPNTGCKSASAQPLTFGVATASPGQYALTYTVTDQAGNQSAPVTINYYLDQTAAPAMTGGIGIPPTVANGSVFSASGTDDMDFASANAALVYGSVGTIVVPATSSAAGVAFDNTLTRASTVTVTLANFIKSLGTISGGAITAAQVAPTQIRIRGLDAANNLSVADAAAIPSTNVSAPTALVIGTDLADFAISANPTTVANGTSTTGARSTTLSATVTAVDANHGTPFSQVCFYISNPSGAEGAQAAPVTGGALGELSLLGCTNVTATTLVGTSKLITSTFTFDPDAAYGNSGSLSFVAIGITSAGDALATPAGATITLTN